MSWFQFLGKGGMAPSKKYSIYLFHLLIYVFIFATSIEPPDSESFLLTTPFFYKAEAFV